MADLGKLFDFSAVPAPAPAPVQPPTQTPTQPSAPAAEMDLSFLGVPPAAQRTPDEIELENRANIQDTGVSLPIPAKPADLGPSKEERAAERQRKREAKTASAKAWDARLEMYARRRTVLADYKNTITNLKLLKIQRRTELMQALENTMLQFDKDIADAITESNRVHAIPPDEWDAQYSVQTRT